MNTPLTENSFPIGRFIKEVGRGKKGARSLARDDAYAIYEAMLDNRVSDLEVGGFMLAMRIKGESVQEIAGFLDAAEASFDRLDAPAGGYAPVVIPSYNGSRQMPNLTPLLACLLARQGVPVLIHGMVNDPGRVTTAEILQEMGIAFSSDNEQVQAQFAHGLPAFMPIATLAPKMAHLLSLRRILSLRNSTHTLVKLLQPFKEPALRLTSYTHPDYFTMLTEYFGTAAPAERGDVFLMRGTEGETVANAKRGQQIEWFHNNHCTTLVERQAPVDELPNLPEQSDAKTTATWIAQALEGKHPVPGPIAEQVEHCISVSRKLRAGA
jgi:anthranilate phosphoribosyltransferase